MSEAELEASRISAAIVDEPSATAVTRPLDATVATCGSDEVHEIVTPPTVEPASSRATAWSWSVSPGTRKDGTLRIRIRHLDDHVKEASFVVPLIALQQVSRRIIAEVISRRVRADHGLLFDR